MYFFRKPQYYHYQVFRPSKNVILGEAQEDADNFYEDDNKREEARIGYYTGTRTELGLDLISNPSAQIASTQNSPKKVTSLYTHEYQECSTLKIQRISYIQISQLLHKEVFNTKNKSENGSQKIIRMIKKSQEYDQTVESKTKSKWVDKNFKRQTKFTDANRKDYRLTWQRLCQQKDNNSYNFIVKPIELKNVRQGLVGDCYFLAALAALTDPQKPQRILKMFPSITMNERKGVYKARLMFKGILQQVVVDDDFPYFQDQQKLKLLGCKPCETDQEIYTLVLEKCWAKLCQSYQAIDGGLASTALRALSGAITKNINISSQKNLKSEAKFLSKLSRYCKYGYVMCAGTQSSSTVTVLLNNQQTQIAISGDHIYCITQVKKQQKLVRIYNPWGRNMTEGSHGDSGQFTISWQQFKSLFHHVTICKIRDNAHYIYKQMNFKANEWKFIKLNITEHKTGYFAISISETFDKRQGQFLNVNYVVLKKKSQQQYQLVTVRSRSKYADHYLELHKLEKAQYLIAVYISSQVQIKELLTFGVSSQDTFGFEDITFPKKFTDNFLPRVFLDYDNQERIRLQKQQQSKKKPKVQDRIYPIQNIGNGNVWISSSIMGQSRLGYIILTVGKNQKEIELQMSCESFSQFGLGVLSPSDTPTFKLVAKPGFSSVATIIINNRKIYEGKDFKDNRQFFRQISKGPLHFWRTSEANGWE